jgi:hypothetical protein
MSCIQTAWAKGQKSQRGLSPKQPALHLSKKLSRGLALRGVGSPARLDLSGDSWQLCHQGQRTQTTSNGGFLGCQSLCCCATAVRTQHEILTSVPDHTWETDMRCGEPAQGLTAWSTFNCLRCSQLPLRVRLPSCLNFPCKKS